MASSPPRVAQARRRHRPEVLQSARLHFCCYSTKKIVDKEPSNLTISPSDMFQFNHKFTKKMRRIKVLLTPIDRKKKVIDDVKKDRRFSLDACIMRIMKSCEVMGHQ